MSPEERAEKLKGPPGWFDPDDRVLIAAAIREAVAEEREACAEIVLGLVETCVQARKQPNYLKGMTNASRLILEAIRARSKETLPEEIQEGERSGQKPEG